MVSQLEQAQFQFDVIVHGVEETNFERANEWSDDETNSRVDTEAMVCVLFNDACGISVTPSDIQAAFCLRTNSTGPQYSKFHSHPRL